MSCCNGSKVAAYDTDSTLLYLFMAWMLDNAAVASKVQDMEDRREEEEEGETKRWEGCDLEIVYEEGKWIERIKEERSESEDLVETSVGRYLRREWCHGGAHLKLNGPLSDDSTRRNIVHYFHLAGMTLGI